MLPHFFKYAELHFVKYAQTQLRSDRYPILLNMQSHSCEATVAPRAGVTAGINYMQNDIYDYHFYA